MNTLLLPTNTANCTTKNLKMIAAVICLTAVFVFGNISVFAQTNEETPVSIPVNGKLMTIKEAQEKQAQTSVKAEAKQVQVVESKSTVAPQKQAVKSDPSKLPYYNYKGINNIEEAKALWVNENPEAYKKMQSNNVATSERNREVKPYSGPLPNADRILPANYDDSKSNTKSKE